MLNGLGCLRGAAQEDSVRGECAVYGRVSDRLCECSECGRLVCDLFLWML